MATWPRHMISFVIISNDIPLSPLIAFTYHLIPICLHSRYTKPHLSIVGNRLSYIALLRSALAVILFVGTRLSFPPSYDCWVSELRWMWDHLAPTNYQSPVKAVVVASQWKSVLLLEATGLLEVVKSWWRGARPAGRSRSGSLREPGIFWVWLQRVVRSLE